MGNRKIAILIVGVYALSLIASAITIQPVQAAGAAGHSEYVIPDSTDQLYPLSASPLSMVDLLATKTSNAGGVVNPGDTITYTVSVNNTGASTHNDIVITDPLPAGTSYIPQSTKVIYTTAPVVRTYRDEFTTAFYNNSHGTANWSAYPWIEEGSDIEQVADSGEMLITGEWLRFAGSIKTSRLTRSVPLAGAVSAVLTFDYRVSGTIGPEDIFAVKLDDGTGFNSEDTYSVDLSSTESYFLDISAFANANTRIQLVVQSFTGPERLEIDNFQIQYTLPGTTTIKDNIQGGAGGLTSGLPPTMVSAADDFDMAAGSTLTMTYQVRVDTPAAAGTMNIVNTAEVRSDGMSVPLQATASDRLRGVHLLAQKTAAPAAMPETGGSVTFTYEVTNSGVDPVTINTLVDDRFGPLPGDADCKVGTELAGGATCAFDALFHVPAGEADGTHFNTFTVSGSDGFGNTGSASEEETVRYTNVLPDISVVTTASSSTVAETGGSVYFKYTVTNNSAEAVTITSLMDDRFGELSGDANCAVNTVLAGSKSCSFPASFNIPAGNTGGAHTNTFTAAVRDNEGSTDTAGESETITYTDVPPDISVTKAAGSSTVPETGGSVTYTFTVTSNSMEPVTISSLTDNAFGILSGDGDCQVQTVLAGGASCAFDATFVLDAADTGDTHTNIFTAVAADDEGGTVTATDEETVNYIDVAPQISVLKTAAVSEVVETGESVTFTFAITNNSLEDAEITALHDDQFGPLSGDADCQVGTVLAGGASCAFDADLAIPAGAVGSTHVNTFTAVVEDNDDGCDSASESETITYTAAPAPAMTVLKEVFADGSWWDANTAPGPEIRYRQNVAFRITVRNTGDVTLTGLTLADSLYSTSSCILPGSLSTNDGVDGSGTDEISCIFIAPWALGQHTNTATASASYETTPVSASDDANYIGVNNTTDLAVTNSDDVDTYTPGEPLNYTIVVTNNGPDPVTGATFTDAMPAQIAGWTWTCAQTGGASGCAGVASSTADFTNTIDLPVGGSITYTVVAATQASAITTLTNTASVSTPAGTDDTNPGNNSASEVDTAAPRVNLVLNKAVDGQFRAGTTLGYTLTVTNNGPSDAANVVLSDMLPDEVTFVSANPAIASGPNPVTWNLGTLASGASRSIHLVVRVKEWVNQPFTNTASVTTTTPESSAADNSDDAVADLEELTPVTLLYFRATPASGLNVLVEWKAETEVDHFAYKLYRSTTPVFADAEELVIVEPNAAKVYSYTDTVPTAGNNYYYWLVDISTTSAIAVHDPVLVIFNALRFYLPVVVR